MEGRQGGAAYLGTELRVGGEEFQRVIPVFEEGRFPFGAFSVQDAVFVEMEVGIDLGEQEAGVGGFQFREAALEWVGGFEEFGDFGVEGLFGGVIRLRQGYGGQVGETKQGVYSFHYGFRWMCSGYMNRRKQTEQGGEGIPHASGVAPLRSYAGQEGLAKGAKAAKRLTE